MSIGPAENAGLGPCELQDPVWAKMSALAAGVKKRKKSETKPQAQINKCNNEKRRREQENIYIEELAELISENFADMSSLSVKPDKCAILQETVNQIRSIKQREGGSQSSDPVQQGEVSSSRPAILSTDVYGPLLLEALEGFLFVVNAEGKVEHVTKNVCNYIKYTEEEVLGKSIYNFIHLGDHERFSRLMPMSIGWASEPTNKSRSVSCRLLVKSSDDQEESMEEKQQRVTRYDLMHISSTQLGQGAVNDDESGDSGPCLLCVASRITYRDRAAIASIDSFTTKLDTTGKIIGVDTSGVSSYSQFLNKDLMGRVLQELCAQQDVHKLSQHLRDTLSAGQATSVVYRLRIGQDKFLHVQTKSKLFKSNPHSNETDFIMATHSIMGENDSSRPSDPGGGSSNSGSIGGPLMTSVVNGTRNGPPITTGNENSTSMNNTLLSTNSTMYTSFLETDFNFDNITSTWEIPWTEPRPDSRQSVTPVSTPTPRPPSAPTYSPGTTVAQSPITHFVTQPSPSVQNPSTPANTYNSTFTFSPAADPTFPMEEQKDTKAIVLEESSTIMADSGRLRTLLSKPPNSVDSANDSDNKNKHMILKTLLNQPDEDDNLNENRSPRGSIASGRNSVPGPSELPKTNTSGGNNMLLQLLNEKSDDDDREARIGLRNQSELLQQLLKDGEQKSEMQSQDDSLLRSLGFTNSPSPTNGEGRGRKRPSDDRDECGSKRTSDGVSSSGSTGSKLCEKNKMLASLLAKQPNNQPIPPVPNSVITATPQEKLPRIIPDPGLNKTLPNNRMIQQGMQQQQQQQQLQNVLTNSRTTRLPGRPSNTSYLNQIPTPGDSNLQRTTRQFTQVELNSFTSSATSSTDSSSIWDNIQTTDPLLSQILDQVIDIVPDAVMTDGADILTLLEPPQNNSNSFHQPLSEKMAINIIQKSLMQCESAVNSPSSPTITLPATPPAYPSVAMTTQTSQSNFPPPPNYPRGFNIQRAATRPGPAAPQYAGAAVTSPQQQQLILHKKLIQQQQRERDKRRLLQQQQQQHLLIPSNAVEINPGLQNIDTLLNNTVAPNVSLQRSSSVPESQLSPNYGGQISQQNQRLNNQQPYSPHSQLTSPLGQQSGFTTQTPVSNYQQHGGARLSPHPPFTQQLSPRQAYPQATTQNTNWQQNQARLSVQQQQNPMLNAQLTGNYVSGSNNRSFPVQRAPQQQQRAIGNPGAAATRHSPFPADSFAPPGSPNSTTFNQNQYLRLQRANSAPTATTQLPGVSGSGTTSEYVRQELRNVVGARSGQTQPANNRSQNTLHQAVNSDLDLGGLSYEMPTSGASESPKLWGAMGSDMGSMSPQPATSRTTMEEARQGDHSSRSSLLQKLLSE